MCFSATASFVMASLTGAAGIAALARVRSTHQIPLAAFPLLFSAQQSIEGVLWLVLPMTSNSACVHPLAVSFVLTAEVIWPVLAPLAILLVEPILKRRQILGGLWIAGFLVSANSLIAVIENPLGASIVANSIRYANDFPYFSWWPALYGLATLAPPLLSSHRPIRGFGILVLIGYAVSAYAYDRTLTSVWCFFAAAASLILLFQFVRGFGHMPGDRISKDFLTTKA